MKKSEDGATSIRQIAYVISPTSLIYEERCICDFWPPLGIANTITEQACASQIDNFEQKHMKVLMATLPDIGVDLDPDWLTFFQLANAYVFVALLDPALHQSAVDMVKRFWLCRPQALALEAIEMSLKTLVDALRIFYSNPGNSHVDESELVASLRDLLTYGGAVAEALRAAVTELREDHTIDLHAFSIIKLFA